jgi:hypothetical protein
MHGCCRVWKAHKPARRPNAPGVKTSIATIARMKSALAQVLVNDLSPESWRAVIAALERGDLLAVENLMLGDERAMSEAWGERFVQAFGGTYTQAANAELARVGAGMSIELYRKADKPKRSKNRFPGVPHNDDFIRSQAAALVVSVSRDQRQAIRETLLARYNRRVRLETTVRDLRNVVGLDPRRARALRTFEDQLRTAGARGVDAQVQRYKTELVRNRAETIARTESVAIENQARIEAWDIAIDSGALPSDAEQEWVSSSDPCQWCQAMDGQRVPVGEAFQSERYGEVFQPPLHPNCLCLVVLRSFK